MTAPTDLRSLLDDAAVRERIARYAQATDARDVDAIVACFTADARLEFEGGTTVAEGHDEIRGAFERAFATPNLAPPAASTHLMVNTIVDLDGDRAHAETQAVAHLASEARGVVTRGLRYSDDLVRAGDQWLLARRVHRLLWQTEAPGRVVTAT